MRGVTLVEMTVVLVLLGLISGVGVLALGGLHRPSRTGRAFQLERSRTRAIHLGEPVTFASDSGQVVRFLSDGRAVGQGINPITGHPIDATR